MHFEWDERKNRAYIRKHGFDFADAEEVFSGALLVFPSLDDESAEERWIGIGTIRARVVVIVFTERDAETIRIISLRRATQREREQYEEAIKNGLEAG